MIIFSGLGERKCYLNLAYGNLNLAKICRLLLQICISYSMYVESKFGNLICCLWHYISIMLLMLSPGHHVVLSVCLSPDHLVQCHWHNDLFSE